MSAFKGTPGPWTVDNPEGSLGSVDAVNDDVRVAQAQEVSCFDRSRGSPRRKANARLIAAAPDLLDTVDELLLEIERAAEFCTDVMQKIPSDSIRRAKEAIAKATGEQA